MAPPIGIPAINTWLYLGASDSPATFTNPIANVGDIAGPGLTAAVVDVTSHSALNPWREKLTTLLDGGQVTFPLFFDPGDTTSHQLLLGVFAARSIREYKLRFPDGRYAGNPSADTIWFFSASIKDFKMDAKVADVLRASITLEVTGEPIIVTAP